MNLRLIREPTIGGALDGATPGLLLVDDRFFAWSLEDAIREVAGQPVEAWKLHGQTAIPIGRYRVTVSHSPRFKRPLPLLVDVPGFLGIRIHPFNRPGESEGCIGIGRRRGKGSLTIEDSRDAHVELELLINATLEAGERVFITIDNPLSWGG